MTRILVSGASGFIGKRLVPELRDTGHDVLEVNRKQGDVADESTWTGLPQVEAVVHLAGKSFVPDSWLEPGKFLRCNLQGTIAALDYCRKHGARLIFLSSYLYGDIKRQPIPESAPLIAGNPYALSKKLAEEACRFYAENFSVPVTILRLFNVFGPGQAEGFLIPSIIRQVIAGQAIRVKDLEPRRDYVYLADVARAIVEAVRPEHGPGVYNIGSGVSYSVAEVIARIQEVWRTSLPVHSDNVRRKDEIMDTIADIAEAKRGLGWKPRFTLLEGLKDISDSRPAG